MRLLVRSGPLAGRIAVVTGPLDIGRTPENGFQLPIEGVSRHHAKLAFDRGQWWIEDLSSANGTFVNGRQITRAPLTHLDVVAFGTHVEVVVEALDQAATPPPAVLSEFVGLEGLDGPDEGRTIPLRQGDLTFGRWAPADIVIDSRVVSKIHARIHRQGDRVTLDNLDAPNGTFVNGSRVLGSRPLDDGDVIDVAGVRRFRVHLGLGGGGAPAAEATIVRGRPALSVRLHGKSGDFALGAGAHVVGRQQGVAVYIDDRLVSRRHAVITVSSQTATVEDQQSANGTLLNGNAIKTVQPLRDGDRLQFGDAELVVELHAAT